MPVTPRKCVISVRMPQRYGHECSLLRIPLSSHQVSTLVLCLKFFFLFHYCFLYSYFSYFFPCEKRRRGEMTDGLFIQHDVLFKIGRAHV